MNHSNHNNFYNSYRPIIMMHVLSHQPERVRAASSGDQYGTQPLLVGTVLVKIGLETRL